MLALKETLGDCYCMIGAPYISDESRKICQEMGIGCLDLAGNCLLIHKSLYVWIEGKPNRFKERRGSKSIFERSSVQSGMILRCLMKDPRKVWKLQDLATASSSSIGQVSKVKKFLDEREFSASASPGFFIRKPRELVLEWGKVYNSKPNVMYECYSLDSVPQFEQRLAAMNSTFGLRYALTGFAGGARFAPAVNYNKIHVYIQLQDLEEAIRILDCRRVSSGANISIIIPDDACVLADTRNIDGHIIASPLQVSIDLLGLKGRGEEAAAAIINREYNP